MRDAPECVRIHFLILADVIASRIYAFITRKKEIKRERERERERTAIPSKSVF
jgi:hypothetical protein